MDYRLTFTIYGALFSIMLVITFFLKGTKKTVRKKLYSLNMITAMIFALSELLTFIIYLDFTQNPIIFGIFWKIRMASIFMYLCTIIWYYDVLINGQKYQTIKETIFKSKKNTIFGIFLIGLSLIYILLGNYMVESPENIMFIAGNIGFGMLTLAISLALYLLFVAIKMKKERKSVYNSFVLIFFILIIVSPIQVFFPNISFMPLLTIFISYILYYNLEDPDIEILEEVEKLKDKIDKSNNTKTDFLFKLSYNLLNPVHAIVSLSTALKNTATFDEEIVKNDIKNIKYAGSTLLDSIDNILELSETDEEENKVINKEYSLFELVNRMNAVAISRIGEKPIQFELEVADNINSVLYGDITKIQKVLINVITNSAKYTEIGKIKMTVTSTTNKDIYLLNFRISDTGNGIKEENMQYIFEDHKDSKTAGLGLALSKRYVEAMNGKITCKSVYGAGTTFTISIPQTPIGTKLVLEDKRETTSAQKTEIFDCSNYKVLLVDDDKLDIKITSRFLSKYKFDVTTITSGSECIDRIKQDEKYDLILLDDKMPELDGIQTMRILKKLEGYELPKIVALTANVVNGARETYIKEGFDYYLPKPIDTNELDLIIKKTIKTEK